MISASKGGGGNALPVDTNDGDGNVNSFLSDDDLGLEAMIGIPFAFLFFIAVVCGIVYLAIRHHKRQQDIKKLENEGSELSAPKSFGGSTTRLAFNSSNGGTLASNGGIPGYSNSSSLGRPDSTYADLNTPTNSRINLNGGGGSVASNEKVLLNAVPGINTDIPPRTGRLPPPPTITKPMFTNVFLERAAGGTVSSAGTTHNGTVSFNPATTASRDYDNRSLFRSPSLEENRDVAQVQMGKTLLN